MPRPTRKKALRAVAIALDSDSDDDAAAVRALQPEAMDLGEDEDDYQPEDDTSMKEEDDIALSEHATDEDEEERELPQRPPKQARTKKTASRRQIVNKPAASHGPIRVCTIKDTLRASRGKRELLEALLGDAELVDSASKYRDAWANVLDRVPLELVSQTRLDPLYDFPDVVPGSEQQEFLVERLSEIADYLPPLDDQVEIEFVKPGTTNIESKVMKTYEVHDTAASEPDNGSFTISTGLDNSACAWSCTTPTQYLAVGGLPLSQVVAPMFDFPPGPGCIQLWEVSFESPRRCNLVRIYTHDYGNCWDLKWQPTDPISDPGLLSCLFGDGTIRIFKVSVSDRLEHYHLKEPRFTLYNPESGFTAFDWLSPVKVAAATSTGSIVIWNLASDHTLPISSTQLHHSYINNLVSCGPLILSTSWDCEVKVSHPSHPETNYMSPSRERMASYAATYFPHLQCGIINEDVSGARIFSIRIGEAANLSTHRGAMTSLHASPAHPFLAIGDATGVVVVVNVIRRYLLKKQTQVKRRVVGIEYASARGAYRVHGNSVDELIGRKTAGSTATSNIWPKQVTVNAVKWNTNPGYEDILASAIGRFIRIDKVD